MNEYASRLIEEHGIHIRGRNIVWSFRDHAVIESHGRYFVEGRRKSTTKAFGADRREYVRVRHVDVYASLSRAIVACLAIIYGTMPGRQAARLIDLHLRLATA